MSPDGSIRLHHPAASAGEGCHRPHTGRRRPARRSVDGMGRGDLERIIAEQERRLAQVERKLVENRDRNELTHFRAMQTHERAAEIHDALAEFFPNADD
jgi:hypothetical protein